MFIKVLCTIFDALNQTVLQDFKYSFEDIQELLNLTHNISRLHNCHHTNPHFTSFLFRYPLEQTKNAIFSYHFQF